MKALIAGCLGLILIASCQAAIAGPARCAPREAVLDRLTRLHGETRRSTGLAGNNVLFEMFANTQTGNWTLMATLPGGISCLVADGIAFEEMTETPAPEGDPA